MAFTSQISQGPDPGPSTVRRHEERIKVAQTEDDSRDIADLGMEQAFIRKFSFWSALGISVCCSGTWEGISAATAQALYSGGSTSLLYGYLAASLGGVVIASSLAELASAWPTSGAMYHWIAALFDPKYRPIVGCITGVFILGTGWIGVASAGFGVAVQTQAYVILAHEAYEPQRWHALLIFWATLLVAFLLNLSGPKVAHYLNLAGMVIHIAGFVIVIIVLLACTKEKQSAKFVFTGFQNYTGWNDGVAWCIGLLSSVYGFVGLETCAYYAEEVQHASRNVPRAILWNAVANAIMTLPFIVTVLFCMGDLESVLNSPIGSMSPMTQIYYNSTGSVGAAITLNAMSTSIAFIATVDAMGAGCRGMFAMSRDGLFPEWLALVHERLDIPLYCLYIVAIPPALFGLIYLGNETAFYGFMSGVLVSTMMLYAWPIANMLVRKLWANAPQGPWRMPKTLGRAVNGMASLWALFLVVMLSLPTMLPVTRDNMNYASVMVSAVFLLGVAVWFGYSKTSSYLGPAINLAVIDATTTVVDNIASAKDVESRAGRDLVGRKVDSTIAAYERPE